MGFRQVAILSLILSACAPAAVMAADSASTSPQMSVPVQGSNSAAKKTDLEKMFDPPPAEAAVPPQNAQDEEAGEAVNAALSGDPEENPLVKARKPLRLPREMQDAILAKEQRNLMLIKMAIAQLEQKQTIDAKAEDQNPKNVAVTPAQFDNQQIGLMKEQLERCLKRIALLQGPPMTSDDLRMLKLLY